MLVCAVVYVAGMIGLLILVDRRMRAAQAAHEAAFLRFGFTSFRRPADRLSLGLSGVPLRADEGRAAESLPASSL